MTRNVLATPSAGTHMKVILCKMSMVVLATCADENPRLQAIAVTALMGFIWWTLLSSVSGEKGGGLGSKR